MRTRRPISAVTAEAKKSAKQSIASPSPLEVMLENMRFWHGFAHALTQELEALLSGNDDRAFQKQSADRIHEALLNARENAQQCAVAAAPYVHPKLKPVRPRSEPTNITMPTELLSLMRGEHKGYEGYDGERLAHLYRKLN